jgi:hypothetical protein
MAFWRVEFQRNRKMAESGICDTMPPFAGRGNVRTSAVRLKILDSG